MLIIRRRRRPSRRDEEEYVSFPTEGGGGNPLIDAMNAIVAGPTALADLAAGAARALASVIDTIGPLAASAKGIAERIGSLPLPDTTGRYVGNTESVPKIAFPTDRPTNDNGTFTQEQNLVEPAAQADRNLP